jgi:hypothetical protein
VWAPGTNVFGVDVSHLDVAALLSLARVLFPLLALAWLAVTVRVGRPGWLLAGVVLANAYVWLETTWPLQRLYALGPSSDRVNNLALCQVVAAGHSPLVGPQVGKAHFEPFWAVVTAVLTGFDAARLLRLYAFLPFLTAAGFAVSLYFALRPMGAVSPCAKEPDGDTGWCAWQRATIAAFATLLSSDPLDYAGAYRVPWAMTFLLKPNHALGLVLLPWVVRGFANIRTGRDAVKVGLLLHVLGWVFVIHMGIASVGLLALATIATCRRDPEARRDRLDAVVVIAINLVALIPYLVLLFRGYGVFDAGPRLEIPPGSPHALEATTRMAWLTALAGWGAATAWRRDRLGRAWVGQAAGVAAVWTAYYALSALQQAKERDDVYYLLRILLAILGAVGAWDLLTRAATWMGERLRHPAWRAAILAGLTLPFSAPYWWNPGRMDLYFAGSLEPLPEEVRDTAHFVRSEVGPSAVFAGDAVASRWMSALAGSRVLIARDFAAPRDWGARIDLNTRLLRGAGDPVAFATRWGVTHVLVTPELLANYDVSLREVEARPYLKQLHFAGNRARNFIVVFALARPQA